MSAKSASWLEIDLTRLDGNLAAWRHALCPADPDPLDPSTPARDPAPAATPGICAVVKADAYGLGAGHIARRLAWRGVDMLAVYCPDQARELLTGGLNCPILLLMPVHELARADPLYRLAVAGRLHLTVHGPAHAEDLAALGRRFGIRLPVHLYADTGMSRGGVPAALFDHTLAVIAGEQKLRLAGIATHFATGPSQAQFLDEQMDRFDRLLAPHRDRLPGDCIIHAAGTFAALRHRRYHRGMVRLGLGLLGYGPELLEDAAPRLEPLPRLEPILRWVSTLVHVERFPAGATVGYDRTCTLQRHSVLGLVPVGFADGYPLALSNGASIAVHRPVLGEDVVHPAPLLGRVSMDQIVVDLTDLPGAAVGDRVELISTDPSSPCALPQLAKLAGSHCYELLCRLSPRLPRTHLHDARSKPNPVRLRRGRPAAVAL